MINLRLLIKRTVILQVVPPARGTYRMRNNMVTWIRNTPFRRLGQAIAADIHRVSSRSGFARRFFM